MRDSVRARIGRLERKGENIALEDCPMCQEKALLVIVEDNGEKNCFSDYTLLNANQHG